MYELIVIACLLNQPTKCEEFYPPFQQPMGAMQCMQEAELKLVHWAEEWPDWQIRRWSCSVPKA